MFIYNNNKPFNKPIEIEIVNDKNYCRLSDKGVRIIVKLRTENIKKNRK